MVRLSRVQQHERTRATLLAAAVGEFAEHGYADAKVDRIAERAELTRGAVYSNFPSKRALYLAVLLDSAASPEDRAGYRIGHSVRRAGASGRGGAVDVAAAAEAFARVWLERLPLWSDPPAPGKLTSRSLTGVFDDQPGRAAVAGLTGLEGLLLALALESSPVPAAGRRPRGAGRPERGPAGQAPAVAGRARLARLILTLLHGSGHLAETAPGFGDPFDVALACRHLAEADPGDDPWDPPDLPYAAAAKIGRASWTPPTGLIDLVTGRPVDLGQNGVVVLLGTGRLDAAEEVVRTVRPGVSVTVAVVTDDPREIGALVRLRITEFAGCLGQVFGPPSLRVVLDDQGALASALDAGTAADTEVAIRIRYRQIFARAQGRGAGYSVAAD